MAVKMRIMVSGLNSVVLSELTSSSGFKQDYTVL